MSGLDQNLSNLIGRLYDCAVDETKWNGLGKELAGAFNGHSSVIKLQSPHSTQVVETTDNFDLNVDQEEWARSWHERDLWVERSRAYPAGTIITSQELVSHHEIQRSGFYQEWLKKLDIFHMLGVLVPIDHDTTAVVGVHRTAASEPFCDLDQRRFGQLVPHLRRAFQIRQTLAGERLAKCAALAALDHLAAAILLLDESLRIRFCNAMAEKILDRVGLLRVVSGRLSIREPSLQSKLQIMVGETLSVAKGGAIGSSGILALPRGDELPLTLTLAPLPAERFEIHPPQALAMVILRDGQRTAFRSDDLRSLFGLTASEAKIAADLCLGLALDTIARRRGIALATVRSHLKRILQKSGTTRQAEAVSLFARIAGGTNEDIPVPRNRTTSPI